MILMMTTMMIINKWGVMFVLLYARVLELTTKSKVQLFQLIRNS